MAWVRACALVGSITFTAVPAAAKPELLPLKRVRFYETGVAYFERAGAVRNDEVTLPVPASHLDDALKTLVVFSSGGATRLGGIEFPSSVSRGMAKALAGIGPGQARLSLLTLLESLKGASVQLDAAGGAVSGRLVEVLSDEDSDLTTCVTVSKEKDAACTPQKAASIVV